MDVLYVGDYKLQANQYYTGADAFQVFRRRVRDYEPLLEALEGAPAVDVEFMDSATAIEEFPRSLESLQEYDVLLLSDLTRGTLEPHFQSDAIPGPNMLKVIRRFVESGGGLVYCGGWMTFQGYQGVGNWAGTPVEAVLPVEIQPIYDDRVERPEGGAFTLTDTEHEIVAPFDSDTLPDVYGYNVTGALKDGAQSLATVDGNHLLTVGEFGQGRTVAYASDPAPKWGFDLMEWDGYAEFWVRALEWASGD